jgi:hypothetical protein
MYFRLQRADTNVTLRGYRRIGFRYLKTECRASLGQSIIINWFICQLSTAVELQLNKHYYPASEVNTVVQ